MKLREHRSRLGRCATNNLEAIGDIIETNLVTLGRSRLENDFRMGDESRRLVEKFDGQVGLALDLAVAALLEGNAEDARRVLTMKDDINERARAIGDHYNKRLSAPGANRIDVYRFETDLVTNLRCIYYFAKRTARVAIPTSEQASS